MHLPDDDTFMENATAPGEQARTADTFAPGAAHHISPIRLDSKSWRAGRDPRSASRFGAAWAARVVKALALALVEDAAFDFGPGYATDALAELALFAGSRLYDVKIHAAGYAPVDALAFDRNGLAEVWLINKTNRPQSATLENPPQARAYTERRMASETAAGTLRPHPAQPLTGPLIISLKPYEIAIVEFVK